MAKRHNWIIFSLIAGAVLLLIIVFGLSGTAPAFANDSQGLGGAFSILQGTPRYEQVTPVPHPTINLDAASGMIPSNGVISNPALRRRGSEAPTAAELISDPFVYENYLIELTGIVISINDAPSDLMEDWEDAKFLVLDDSSAWIPVVYRGGIGEIEVGDTITAVGVFYAEGKSIIADFLKLDTIDLSWWTKVPGPLLWAWAAVILLGLIPGAYLLSKRLIASIVLLGLIPLSLSACEIQINNYVYSDNSVATQFEIIESQENVEFLREIPGMKRYIDSWITELRSEGMLVENWVEGNKELFLGKQTYPNLETFSAADAESVDRTWVYVESFVSEGKTCYRYMAHFNPEALYDLPEGTGSAIESEANKLLNDVGLTYRVTLPGRVTYSNADMEVGNLAEWHFGLDKENDVIAESCRQTAGSTFDWRWGWAVVIGGLLLDASIWIQAIRTMRS